MDEKEISKALAFGVLSFFGSLIAKKIYEKVKGVENGFI